MAKRGNASIIKRDISFKYQLKILKLMKIIKELKRTVKMYRESIRVMRNSVNEEIFRSGILVRNGDNLNSTRN